MISPSLFCSHRRQLLNLPHPRHDPVALGLIGTARQCHAQAVQLDPGLVRQRWREWRAGGHWRVSVEPASGKQLLITPLDLYQLYHLAIGADHPVYDVVLLTNEVAGMPRGEFSRVGRWRLPISAVPVAVFNIP
jgi:hypothetical protein